ncbi:S-adenosyl-L-methionine-dependent methyltransferase [Astrocystis sublimbata]|nr:S-adenosyl-L-methionine-dependent methyltransferase [Astrocystis sublimbata]
MPDPYAENMSRSASEAARLDEQFNLLTENISYLLLPSVIAALPQKPQVADIGTGTGIFLRSIGALYPEATLHGYDISLALCPDAGSLPLNLEFKSMDVKREVPPELRGKYDLVHVRLLAAAMLPDEWEPVVSNIAQLLKPGGYIQWEECDWAGVKHLRGNMYSSVNSAQLMGRAFRDGMRDRFEHGWDTLPQDMRAAGLCSVESDIISSDRLPETRERMTANGMDAIFSWARLMTSHGKPGSMSFQRLAALEVNVRKDIETGCYVRFDVHVVCGKKPSLKD